MSHYDHCYEHEATKALAERTAIKNKLRQEVEALRHVLLQHKYSFDVPSRFKESLEDLSNYLK